MTEQEELSGNNTNKDAKADKPGLGGGKKSAYNNPYIRFSSMAIQMGALIGLGAWGGTELDERAGNEKPIYTIILCLAAVGISLYLFIREASKLSRDKDDK